MKKKLIAVLLATVAGCCTAGAVSACTGGNGEGSENSHTEHTFTNYVSNGDATCNDDGTKTAKCDGCDYTDTITDYDTRGHIFVDGVCTRCHSPILDYKLSDDGTYYVVSANNNGVTREKEVTVPATHEGKPVKEIAESGFRSFGLVEKITLPESIVKINDYAFASCKALKEIVLHDSVEEIGFNAFGHCESLQSITLPANLKKISCALFDGCTSLKKLHIPAKVEKIEFLFAEDVPALEEITVDENNAHYKSVDNCLLTSDGETMLLGCKNSAIPEGVKRIYAAFSGCSSLTQITLPQSLEIIDESTFYGCTALKSIEIPDGVTEIDRYAFVNCELLTEIKLPASLKAIEYSLFSGCKNLEKLTISEENEKFKTAGNCLLSKDGKTLYEGTNLSVIPEGVETIAMNAFDGRNISNVTLPDSVKRIDSAAFGDCDLIEELILPDNLEYLGSFNFGKKTKFNELDGVRYLGSATNPYFAAVEAVDKNITSLTLSSETRLIAGRAFDECNKITSVTIPDSVVSIGLLAFAGDELASVTLGNGLKFIDSSAFFCEKLKYNVYGNAKYLGTADNDYFAIMYEIDPFKDCYVHPDTQVIRELSMSHRRAAVVQKIEDGVTVIEENTFKWSEVDTIELPASVTKICANAFVGDINEIRFGGTRAQWKAIEKPEGWKNNVRGFNVYCTDGSITVWFDGSETE